MTYQVTDVTKPLNSVSKLCDAAKSLRLLLKGHHQEFVDGRFNALRKRSWSVCGEHVGKKRNAMRKGFCQAGKVISRASRAVSPMLEQESDEELKSRRLKRERLTPLRVRRD